MKCPFFSNWKMFLIIIFPPQLFIFIYLHVILTLWQQLEKSWHCNHRTSWVKIHNVEVTFCSVYKDTVSTFPRTARSIPLWIISWKGYKDTWYPVGDARDMGSIPGLAWPPGRDNGNPLLYFYLENLIDRGGCQAIAYEVSENQTGLSSEHIPFSSVLFGIQSSLVRPQPIFFFFLATDSEVNTDFMTSRKLAQIYVFKLFSSSSFFIL